MVFLYKHSHFPSFAPVGKSLLKVLLYIYIYVLHIRIHTQICTLVCKSIAFAYIQFPAIPGRGIAGPEHTNSNTSRTYCALLIPNTKVLWVCPDLTVPLQQRTTLADPTECPLSYLVTFVSLGRWDQQPPRSDPPCLFSTRFVLWLRHRRRSVRVVLNLCLPKSFLAKPKEMPLKPSLCLSFSNNRTNKSHSEGGGEDNFILLSECSESLVKGSMETVENMLVGVSSMFILFLLNIQMHSI